MEFFDGMPMPETVTASYDALDLIRGIDAFLNCMPGASMLAMRRACDSVGARSNVIACTDPRCTSAPVVLTANTETTYGTTFLDLNADGPTVVEAPPNSLSFVDDLWQRYVADLGNAGPDRGQGGKYLFLPPDHEGEVPDGYYVFQSPTYSNWIVIRALDGLDSLLTTQIYPLAAADDPPQTGFVDFAESSFNGIHANDFTFFEEVNTIVQEEPAGSLDPERAGQLAAIGIVHGQPFAPDPHRRDILDQAARIAAGLARTLLYKPRDRAAYFYDDGSWKTAFVGGSHEFIANGARLLDCRTMMHYVGTGITPAMTHAAVGIGSQYAFTAEDATGAWLDGAKEYTLTLPAGDSRQDVLGDRHLRHPDPVAASNRQPLPQHQQPVRRGAHRGERRHHHPVRTHSTRRPGINWLQTIPGKGWFPILRLYGPLKPWFDQTWRLGEIQPA